VEGGVVLSGHTDVVPVDGQPWTSDPWTLTERDGRLYGRGSCDMKGFLALALAAAPSFQAAGLKRPVHLAFSYDEEVGCLGAPDLIRTLCAELPRPALAVVGEPTDMQVVSGHKGIAVYVVTVRGKEAHSSRIDLGVSAIMAAVRLMGELHDLADRLAREADPSSPFHPPGATLTIGQVHGGTATNILASSLKPCWRRSSDRSKSATPTSGAGAPTRAPAWSDARARRLSRPKQTARPRRSCAP
jgi:acetylornithine deacetylase